MFTLKLATRLGLGACAVLVAAGCAMQQRSGDVPRTASAGSKLNLGAAATSAEIAHYFSYPADGRGLPPGSGSYAQGEKVYQTKCMACHGDKLQGTPLGDRLIGGRGTLVNNSPAKAPVKTVESYWPYATSVFDYVKRAMPFNAPGSLTDDEAYAVVAYILGEANIVPKNAVINATTLAKVEMPNRNGFVSPDPRPDVP
jgi:S-disulfanyl-L-cysteine oxidoreductase SoxD